MKYFVLLIIATLASCASPYGPKGINGGYKETRYSADTVMIYYDGNSSTSPSRAKDFTTLRAAELCIESGYRYFSVQNSQMDLPSKTFNFPGHATTTGNAYAIGNSVNYQATTTYTPPQSVTTYSPKTSMVVKFYREIPKGRSLQDAQMTVSFLKGKYDL
ncbi:MAG: hypothetical protein EOP85_19925 [Verrucomicrobiaceae bacterium]|nr:MAG: hypothetical protein EOP85_19925 [Verrucomicrobiaceae bacterium]